MKNTKPLIIVIMIIATLGILSAGSFVFAQTDASVTPLTPGWGGPNYDQPLWTITYNKAVIPVSFTSYHCTSAALVLEYATWADYTKIDWQTSATGKYTGFIPASASDLSQKVYITIPNLNPSTSYIFRVGAKCTSSSPMGTLVYTTSANQFGTPAAPAAPSSPTQYGDVTPPIAPDNLQVNDVTETHVALSWNTPADNVAVTRYELKYKIGSGTFSESDWASASSLAAPEAPPPGIMGVTTFGYNKLTPNTTYILGLKAFDAAGNASPLGVSPGFTTLAPPPLSIPTAPTGLTASYSTENLGQPEIRLTVTDNATNETYYQLYWHLSGTTWPNIAPKDTYNSSTWSQPANIGSIQIFAPSISGTYEYRLQACNSAGCSSSNIALVNVPAAITATSNVCTSLAFNLTNNKTTYTIGESVNYSYKCIPEGTSAASVAIQLVKPGGTAITYDTGSNIGAVLQQMGFSTSNLSNGSYILRACLNDTSCGAGSVYPLPFTIVGGAAATATPAAAAPATTTTTTTPAATTNLNSATTIPAPTANPAPNAIPDSAPTWTTPTWNLSPSAPAWNPNQNFNSASNAISAPVTTPETSITAPNATIPQNPATTPPQTPSTLSPLSGTKCKRYLSTTKNTLNSNKRYIKNIRQKLKNAPKNYVNFNAITALLENADKDIDHAGNLIKNKECSAQTLESMSGKQDDINNALQELAGYNKDELRYFNTYTQCRSTLANRAKKIDALIKKEKNKETKSSFQDLISEIAQKSQEFTKNASNAYFPEIINQCKNYINELDNDINFYLRIGKF